MKAVALLGAVALGFVGRSIWNAWINGQEQQQGDPYEFETLSANVIEEIESAVMPEEVDFEMADKNISAFLKMIRHAEGTAGENGYRTLFGGGLFEGFADHPRIAKQFRNGRGELLWTTAAGAYQMLAVSPLPTGGRTRVNTWDRIKAAEDLPDFSPASQDAAAVALIDEAGALEDVRAGRFVQAVGKVRRIWASMPGAGYAQPEKSMEALADVYAAAGGVFA